MRGALATSDPHTFLSLRFGLAAAALLLLFGRRVARLRAGEHLRAGLVGVFLFLGFALQTAGLEHTTASRAGFITGLSVVLVPLFLALAHRRLPPAWTGAGVTLATLGLGLLSLEGGSGSPWGDLLVLGGAVAFALHILAVGRYARRMDPLALAAVQVAVVALLSLTLLSLGAGRQAPGAEVWAAAGFTGLVATALVLVIQNVAQARTSATHTAIIFTLEPVFAALFARWLAAEPLTARTLVGGGLIVLGMLAAELGSALRRPFLPESPAAAPEG